MAFSVDEFVKKFSAFPGDLSLTLFNEQGESYRAGEIKSLVHKKNSVKIRWERTEPFTHSLPLTYGVLHRGKKVWEVVSIKPLDNSADGSELEIELG
jgi:hypothetical protein